MKKYLLALVSICLLALAACKKENGDVQGTLTGKWQEIKLNLRQTGGGIVNDTTFTSANFTNQDFYQFSSDKTAVISKSGNFSFGGKSIVIPAIEIADWVTYYTYNIADTVLNLKPTAQMVNPGDVPLQKQTIIQLDSKHLILKVVYLPFYPTTANIQGSQLSGLVATAYFTKL